MVGEGAGILILEDTGIGEAAGRPILAEIVGYGMSADAFHVTAPPDDGDGAFRVMRNALRDARLRPSRSTTSTPTALPRCRRSCRDDRDQARFGEHAYKLAVSSTKSMTGHLLGGSRGPGSGHYRPGDCRDQIAPPTINYENPDPDCDLDYVPNEARPMKIEYALSNSFGFGGTNGALIFRRYTGVNHSMKIVYCHQAGSRAGLSLRS